MEITKRIYCIEGHWDYNGDVDPSVEPILQTVQAMGYWRYIRRNSATFEEMHYWLESEWNERCANGSILYIASHGAPGEISLSNREDAMKLSALPEGLPKDFAKQCLVHFGGCEVMKEIPDTELDQFLNESGAYAVSGYKCAAGWVEAGVKDTPPSLALELMLFSSIYWRRINLAHWRMRDTLPQLATDIDEQFKDCGFRLRTRWD